MELKPISEIELRFGLNEGGEFMSHALENLERRTEKYIPHGDTGILEGTTIQDVQNGALTYASPYAHYQYIGELYVDPDTGSSWAKKNATKIPTGKRLNQHPIVGEGNYWDKKMISAEGTDYFQELQDFIDRR